MEGKIQQNPGGGSDVSSEQVIPKRILNLKSEDFLEWRRHLRIKYTIAGRIAYYTSNKLTR